MKGSASKYCFRFLHSPAPAGLPYTWKTTAEDGSTYSIDKLLLDFALEYQAGQRVLDGVGALVWVEFSHWTTHKMGAFRDQFTFALEGGRSFWLGVGLNGPSGVNTRRARLEFNPNKVGETRALRWVFNLLYDNSRRTDFPPVVVVRWDFAVDLPGERTGYELVKDGRVYEEIRRSVLYADEGGGAVVEAVRKAGDSLYLIRNTTAGGRLVGFAANRYITPQQLYGVLGNIELAALVRQHTHGQILLISGT